MSDDKPNRLEWNSARARVYHFGHFMLLLIQLVSAVGIAFCGLAILMLFNWRNPDTVTIITVAISTFVAVSIWRGTTKTLNAVGEHGRDYYYDPFKPDEWSE